MEKPGPGLAPKHGFAHDVFQSRSQQLQEVCQLRSLERIPERRMKVAERRRASRRLETASIVFDRFWRCAPALFVGQKQKD